MSSDVTLKAILMGEDRSLSKTMNKAGDSVEKVGKKARGAGATMKGALGAAIVMQATDAILNFGRESIEAFRGATTSQKQLEDAYKRFPQVADVNIGKLREYNETLQKKGYADADDIASGQATLARYKMTGQQLKQLTPLLVDYANRTGKSIPEASKTLGKALGGSSKLAKELGFSLKDAKDPAKNFDQILAGLEGTVGGYSAKMPEAERSSKALGYSFGDLQEAVGEGLLPIMIAAAKIGMQVVDWISQNVSWLGPLAAGFAVVTAGVLLMNAAMMINPFVIMFVAISALVGGLIWAYQNVEWFRNGVNTAFEAIGAVGRWLWNNALAPALRAMINGFAWVAEGVAGFLDALSNIPGFGWAKVAAEGLRGIARTARDAANGIRDIPDPKVKTGKSQQEIATLKARIASLKGKVVEAKAKGDTREVKRLQAEIAKVKSKLVRITAEAVIRIKTYSQQGGGSKNIRDRNRAMGGSVHAGMPYWIGENGPELFWPGQSGHINNQFQLTNAIKYGAGPAGGGSTSVLINRRGLNGGTRAFAEAIERELYNLARSRGPRGQLSFARR